MLSRIYRLYTHLSNTGQADMLDRPSCKYIGLADLVENNNTPPYSSQDSNSRHAISFPSFPSYFEKRQAAPRVFGGLVLYSSLAVASPPYNAVDNDIQP